MSSSGTAEPGDSGPLRLGTCMWRVFWGFGALALLCGASASAASGSAARSRSPATPTTRRPRDRHRQQCHFGAGQRHPLRACQAGRRRAAPRPLLSLAGAWMATASASARRLQQCGGNAATSLFLSIEERMMSRDMSGRFGPIYRSLIVTPGARGPAGLRFTTSPTVRLHERGAGGRRAPRRADPSWRAA